MQPRGAALRATIDGELDATNPHPACITFADLRAHVPPHDTVLLLCRSSVRSVRAATAAAREGYARMYNILEGFEGKLDDQQQRGKIDGWRKAGLPWKQE